MGLCPKCNADYGDKVPKFCSVCGEKIELDVEKSEIKQVAPVAKPTEGQTERVLVDAQPIAAPASESSSKPGKKNAKLPLVLAIVGLCLFWFPLLGLGLGIAAIILWKTKSCDSKAPLVIGVIAVVLGLMITIYSFTHVSTSTTGSDNTSAATEQVVTASENGESDEEADATEVEETEDESTADDEADSEDAPTTAESNAVAKAKRYLKTMPFSYTGLINQLEFEDFTEEEATYGADHCGADWTEQADKKAKSYLNTQAFSYSGLIEQLEFEGFTEEEATHGADNCGADWNEQADKKAESYMRIMDYSRQELIDQLLFEGFSEEEADHGADSVGL